MDDLAAAAANCTASCLSLARRTLEMSTELKLEDVIVPFRATGMVTAIVALASVLAVVDCLLLLSVPQPSSVREEVESFE